MSNTQFTLYTIYIILSSLVIHKMGGLEFQGGVPLENTD